MWGKKNHCIPRGLKSCSQQNGHEISWNVVFSILDKPKFRPMLLSYNVVLSNDAPKIPKNQVRAWQNSSKPQACRWPWDLPSGIPTGAPYTAHQNQVAANKDRKQTQNEVPLSRVFLPNGFPVSAFEVGTISKLDRTILLSTHPNSHRLNSTC
jgi:hypothetical protein